MPAYNVIIHISEHGNLSLHQLVDNMFYEVILLLLPSDDETGLEQLLIGGLVSASSEHAVERILTDACTVHNRIQHLHMLVRAVETQINIDPLKHL